MVIKLEFVDMFGKPSKSDLCLIINKKSISLSIRTHFKYMLCLIPNITLYYYQMQNAIEFKWLGITIHLLIVLTDNEIEKFKRRANKNENTRM
jgi:hypothetical protein